MTIDNGGRVTTGSVTMGVIAPFEDLSKVVSHIIGARFNTDMVPALTFRTFQTPNGPIDIYNFYQMDGRLTYMETTKRMGEILMALPQTINNHRRRVLAVTCDRSENADTKDVKILTPCTPFFYTMGSIYRYHPVRQDFVQLRGTSIIPDDSTPLAVPFDIKIGIRYRHHRRLLSESMETQVELEPTMAALCAHLNAPSPHDILDPVIPDELEIVRPVWDDRIDQMTYLVCRKGYGVLGMVDDYPDDYVHVEKT